MKASCGWCSQDISDCYGADHKPVKEHVCTETGLKKKEFSNGQTKLTLSMGLLPWEKKQKEELLDGEGYDFQVEMEKDYEYLHRNDYKERKVDFNE